MKRVAAAGGGLALLAVACALGRADDAAKRASAVAPVPSAAATDRLLLVTSTLAGNLEPCHCTEGMMGGIPRRASLVARFARKLPVLDLGDLDKPIETDDKLSVLRVRGALEALESVSGGGLHAIALGCVDARLGLARLGKITREVAPHVTWLCANLKGGPDFVKASLEHEGVTIAAVLDPARAGTVDQGELVPPLEGLKELLEKKKPLVVLFHGDPAAAERTLGTAKGISLIVCAHAELPERTRALASGVPLAVLEPNGQRLHAYAIDEKGALHAEASHALDGLLPDSPAARQALDRFYEEATKVAPDLPKRKVEAEGGHFVGSASCKDCHEKAFEIWKKTGHERALVRLKEKDPKRSGLAECVVCHVTGFGYESGWSPRTPAPQLSSVGCESCHGPGSNHIERASDPKDALGYGRPARGKDRQERWRERCMLCHDPENSPGFEIDSYLEKIQHWDK